MEKQVTIKQRWLQVETTHGTAWINVFDTGLDLPNSAALPDGVNPANSADVQLYCDGDVLEWENIEGYGARYSDPGYLDCTEWTVFPSAEEAQAFLDADDDIDEETE